MTACRRNAPTYRRAVPALPSALFAILLLATALAPSRGDAQVPARTTYVFTNVEVIPLDSEVVLGDQTVVVEAGKITALGPASETFVPAGAIRIDGRGRFLLPGLAEMHGHLPAGPDAADILFLYLAGGATTVRGMQGHPAQLELRRQVSSGELLGPRMWLAAPAMSGDSVPDVATAEQLVRQAQAEGYDLLKIHEGLSQPVYDAIVRTATAVGLPWGGHVPEAVGVEGALAAGQSTIDHLDDYIEAMQPRRSPAFDATGPERRRLMAVHADPDTIEDLAEATFEAGVAVVPTQVLWEVLAGGHDPNALMAQPENRYMPRATVDQWLSRVNSIYNNASRIAAAREAGLRQELLKAMSDAGVEILLGTDAPQIFSVPGFSLHRELALMVESGMTPYEVLRTGTVNVARHLGTEATAGTVAVGRNADLLLLDANPLTDIGAVAHAAGVMADGRWLPAETIRARLEQIADARAR
jgi:imidazolonepropionase-like amidohydrolase